MKKYYIFTMGLSLLTFPNLIHAQTGNTLIGGQAGASLTTGDYNSLFGYYAGSGISTGSENVIFGAEAGVGVLDTTLGELLNNGAVSLEPYNQSESVMIGYRAGWQAGASTRNFTAIGYKAGQFNNARDNTFIGSETGLSNTTGFDNTFVGEEAGELTTIGSENTFIGDSAGMRNTVGDNSTFIGHEAGTGDSSGINTSFHNTGVGAYALNSIDTTYSNIAAGFASSIDLQTGVANTSLGSMSLGNTQFADFNTAIGVYAGWENNRTNSTTNANRNINIGTGAGYTNRDGEDNTVIGNFAGSGVWSTDGISPENFEVATISTSFNPAPTGGNTNVSRRVLLGSFARGNQDDTMAIGYESESLSPRAMALGHLSSATHQDSIVIGYGGVSHGDDTIVLGNANLVSIDPDADGVTALGSAQYRYASVTAKTFTAHADLESNATITFAADAGTDNDDLWRMEAVDSGDFTISTFANGSYVPVLSASNNGDVTIAGNIILNSDERLKERIEQIEDASELLTGIRGTTYYWKPELGRNGAKQYGVIAQDVERQISELVKTDADSGMKSVNYQGFIPLLISKANHLEQQRNELRLRYENDLKEKKERIELLQEQVKKQEKIIQLLEKAEHSKSDHL